MSDTYWYFKTSPETWVGLPANRVRVGTYADYQYEYPIWRIPTTTTIHMSMMSYLHNSIQEAEEGEAYLGPTKPVGT